MEERPAKRARSVPAVTRVAIVVSYEGALFFKQMIHTALEASFEALEIVPSVEVKTRIVEKRAQLLDMKDAVDLALLGRGPSD